MLARTRQLLTHLVLAVMLATFMSPTLGWGMVASHDQLVHGTTKVSHIGLPHQHDHGHAHDLTQAGGPAGAHEHQGAPVHQDAHDHQDAHASIGHLLTHLPASLPGLPQWLAMPAARTAIEFIYQPVVQLSPEPPLRPPRADLSC